MTDNTKITEPMSFIWTDELHATFEALAPSAPAATRGERITARYTNWRGETAVAVDTRPAACRFRLADEGKAYPKSSCTACGKGIATGLGRHCTVSATPAPAAGGLEAVAEIEAIFRRHLQANDYAKDLIKRIALDVVPVARKALSAALAAPAATSAPTHVVNCCNCGRIIDTREESEGGDQWGHQLSDNRWVCSPECLDAVADPDATPPASSESAQVREGLIARARHAARVERTLTGNRAGELYDAPADALDECDPAGRIRASLANDGRPAGWTEALALSFMAANGHNPEIGMFAKSFSEGTWQEIESEWPEFVAFAAGRNG